MSLMSSLYVGAGALQTSQSALNTTAHNLTNADTEGFVRQQVQLGTNTYVTIKRMASGISDQQLGLGVSYTRVKQVRDFFLDKTYRKEAGRSMFYEVSSNTLDEVENLLGKMDGKDFQEALADLWTSVQELAKDPSNSVTQNLLVQRSEEFTERAIKVYEGLESFQNNLNFQVKQKVDQINDYGKKILALNDQIRMIEAGEVEKANDLRDYRNQIMDELGALVKCEFTETIAGDVFVQIEGEDFVKGALCFEMGLYPNKDTGFYTPFWTQNATYVELANGAREYNIKGAEVFDLEIEISSDFDTDIGGLKAMLLARGDHRADYTDIEKDYDKISSSILMNIEAEFDQMVHNVTTAINDILAQASGIEEGDLTLEDGSKLEGVRFCEVDPDGYMRGQDGAPLRMFDKITTPAYTKVKGNDGKEYWVYNEEDPKKQDSLYTLKNLQINQELKKSPSKLGFVREDNSVDYKTAEALKEAFTKEEYTLNPYVKKKSTFIDFYSDLVSQVANSGFVYRSIYENQQNTVESTANAREQIMGVSSDEELSNMIRFQNAYNASSRYINALSEMLEHIISTLGR